MAIPLACLAFLVINDGMAFAQPEAALAEIPREALFHFIWGLLIFLTFVVIPIGLGILVILILANKRKRQITTK